MLSQNPIERLIQNNVNSYRNGRNTASLVWNGAGDTSPLDASPLDGSPQFRVDRNHGGNMSSRMTVGRTTEAVDRITASFGSQRDRVVDTTEAVDRITASYGSQKDRVKWIADRDGSGLAWEHRVQHNKNISSTFETGVRNNNGKPVGFFSWVLGFR